MIALYITALTIPLHINNVILWNSFQKFLVKHFSLFAVVYISFSMVLQTF